LRVSVCKDRGGMCSNGIAKIDAELKKKRKWNWVKNITSV
jgi:hypothetical protein